MTFANTKIDLQVFNNNGYNIIHILIMFLVISLLQQEYTVVDAISCFACSSRNHNDITCEDPFNASSNSYMEKCRVPKKGRDGIFPAKFCIKVTGVRFNGSTKETLTVRRCALEDMYNQCGSFKLDHEKFDSGCILTCDQDGCNSSDNNHSSKLFTIYILVLLTIVTSFILSSPLINVLSSRFVPKQMCQIS